MIVDVFRMASGVEIRRERRLPLRGSITVNLGDPVTPDDVVAEASIPSQVLTLDIARGLGIPVSETAACMIREIGEDVTEGDVIAQCDSAFPRFVRAPVDGKLIECRDGKVVVATGETTVCVRAGMTGKVADLIPEIGVIISAQGRLIQGIWGNGRFGAGNLKVVDESWESSLNMDMLELTSEPLILCAGVCLEESVLTHLAATGLSGLVLCSLAPQLTSMVVELPFPVIVIQGFGDLPADLSVRNFFQSSVPGFYSGPDGMAFLFNICTGSDCSNLQIATADTKKRNATPCA